VDGRSAAGDPAAGASDAASGAAPINPDPSMPRTILVPLTLLIIQMLLDALTPFEIDFWIKRRTEPPVRLCS
jgi:hypothetical protein